MAEFRFDPISASWVMIASSRQNRPNMPKDYCPFCPGSGKVPDEGYKVLRYKNDFPAMKTDPEEPDKVGTDFFRVLPSYGICEVILYSPDHTGKLWELTDEHVGELGRTWKQIYEEFSSDPKIKYVLLFENRGEAVGVTMPHPHGQAYGYGFLPQKIEIEAKNAAQYYEQNGKCLFCELLKNEVEFEQRVIFKNEFFTVVLPFFSQYPYGVYVFANEHILSIGDFNKEMTQMLGVTVKQICGMYDFLFDMSFPYMMCMHNPPVNCGDYSDSWHFHIEFFPPMRDRDKIKFNASSETGAWAHCNPTKPEEKAEELRQAYKRFMKMSYDKK